MRMNDLVRLSINLVNLMLSNKRDNATVIKIAMRETRDDEIISADFVFCVQLKQFYA